MKIKQNYSEFLTPRKDVNLRNKNYKQLSNGLKIDSVSRAEAGTYECIATNQFGYVKSEGANLKIRTIANARIPVTSVTPVSVRTTTTEGRYAYFCTSTEGCAQKMIHFVHFRFLKINAKTFPNSYKRVPLIFELVDGSLKREFCPLRHNIHNFHHSIATKWTLGHSLIKTFSLNIFLSIIVQIRLFLVNIFYKIVFFSHYYRKNDWISFTPVNYFIRRWFHPNRLPSGGTSCLPYFMV